MEVSGAGGVDVEVSSIADSDITGIKTHTDSEGDGLGEVGDGMENDGGWGEADFGGGDVADGTLHALRTSLSRLPNCPLSTYSIPGTPISDLDLPLSENSQQALADQDDFADLEALEDDSLTKNFATGSSEPQRSAAAQLLDHPETPEDFKRRKT